MKNLIIKGVKCRLNENGIAELNLEHVAKGLGFITTAASGNDVVRWNTVHSYLTEFGVAGSCNDRPYKDNCPEFIPENIFYKLCFKAKNEIARGFQDLVTDEILPTIRRTGGYIAASVDESPDEIMAKALLVAKDTLQRREQRIQMLESETEIQKDQIKRLAPKAEYTDQVLQSTSTFTTTQIAKDLGMSAKTLNKKLRDAGIQYFQSGQWMLYHKYQNSGLHDMRVAPYRDEHTGEIKTSQSMVWTEKGRLFIIDLQRKGRI